MFYAVFEEVIFPQACLLMCVQSLQSYAAFICTESELTPEAVKITLIAAKTVSEPDKKLKKEPPKA